MRIRCPKCGRVLDAGQLELGRKVECACAFKFHVDAANLIPDDQVPEIVGRCRIEAELGGGGMATVYLGRHVTLDIPVAVKVLLPDFAADASYVDRFFREARTAAKMNHKNIARVYDCGDEGGTLFLVMEYIDGGSTLDMLEHGPLGVDTVISVALSVCAALIEAEKFGIIHRDIKPENIMRSRDGVFKLADLGLAKQASSAGPTADTTGQFLTLDCVGMGTPLYMPPEQALDAKSCDVRADIYAFGATLYHLLCGHPPFSAEDEFELFRKHSEELPVPPRQLNPAIPDGLEAVILKCMEKRPRDRYQSPREMMVDLRRLVKKRKMTATAFLGMEPLVPPLPEPRKRRGALYLLVPLAALLALASWLIPLSVPDQLPVTGGAEPRAGLDSPRRSSLAPEPAPVAEPSPPDLLAELCQAAGPGGDLVRMGELLKSTPALVNQTDSLGLAPLHYAARHNNVEAAKLLLDHGAKVNVSQEEFGGTPLQYAAAKGHAEMVNLLLNHGADPNMPDKTGRLPSDWAEVNDQRDVVGILTPLAPSDSPRAAPPREPAPEPPPGDGKLIVAVDKDGNIITSSDGTHWTQERTSSLILDIDSFADTQRDYARPSDIPGDAMAEQSLRPAPPRPPPLGLSRDDLVDDIFGGKYQEAFAQAGEYQRELYPADQQRFQEVFAALKTLASLDETIAEELKSKLDKTVTLTLRGERSELLIKKVKGVSVLGEESVGNAKIGVKFTVDELSMWQRQRILAGKHKLAAQLYYGLIACRDKNYSRAYKCYGPVELLGDSLAAKVREREALEFLNRQDEIGGVKSLGPVEAEAVKRVKDELPDSAVRLPRGTRYFFGHFYKLFHKTMARQEAKECCERLGGHLATVDGEKEAFFLRSLLPEGCRGAWLGLERSGPGDKGFSWDGGAALEYDKLGADFGSAGDFGAVDAEFKCRGCAPNEQLPFLCEWSPRPENAFTLLVSVSGAAKMDFSLPRQGLWVTLNDDPKLRRSLSEAKEVRDGAGGDERVFAIPYVYPLARVESVTIGAAGDETFSSDAVAFKVKRGKQESAKSFYDGYFFNSGSDGPYAVREKSYGYKPALGE